MDTPQRFVLKFKVFNVPLGRMELLHSATIGRKGLFKFRTVSISALHLHSARQRISREQPGIIMQDSD